MKGIWMPSIVVAITLAAGIVAAQSPPPPAPGGAFESLSPGNQKIALAIFDSEQRVGSTAATTPLSLDQIAEMKQSGKGWGEVFKGMKSQGLVQDRNLGQAVSRQAVSHQAVSQMSRGGGATAARTEITTASGKTAIVGGAAIPGGKERSGTALSGRQAIGSDDALGNAATSTAVSHGRDGGGGATAAGGGGGSHGGGRGK